MHGSFYIPDLLINMKRIDGQMLLKGNGMYRYSVLQRYNARATSALQRTAFELASHATRVFYM